MSAPTNKPAKPPPKPKNLKFVRAEFSFTSEETDELSFAEGDLLYILDDTSDKDWWRARCKGKEGLVPANYLRNDGSQGADLNPLHDACRRGNIDSLEECLLNRVPVNLPDKAGNTPLHCAAHAGQIECVQRLLAIQHINVNAKNRLEDTPLHQASWRGQLECVRELRAKNADLNAVNSEGKTALDLATDPETLSELKKWAQSLRNKPEEAKKGDYNRDDYAVSDNENDADE